MNEDTVELDKINLTEWEKEPSVMDLKQDLENSKPAHDAHVSQVRKWNDLRNVSGKAQPKLVKGRSKIQPKLIRRQAEWRYSALSEPFLSTEKLFEVSPVTFEDTTGAEQNETVINWQFRSKINKVKFIDEYVRTAVDEGSVIVRLGWLRQTKLKTVQQSIFNYMEAGTEEELTALDEAVQFKAANPRGFMELPEEVQASVDYFIETGVATVATVAGIEEVEEEEILQNKPTVEIISPSNCYLDPSSGGDIEKSNFVIISFETSKAELMKDGRYKNLNKVIWSGNTILGEPDHKTTTPTDFNFNDDLRKRVVAYEYWGYYDVEGKDELTPIVATWIGDTMIRMEANPFPDEKPPFVVVPYLPVRGEITGEPDAEILEDNQAILGAVTRGMIDLMGRSANSQQGTAKGFLDATNKRRFESGQDYEFNPVMGGPSVAVYQHKFPEIPNSALTMLNLQNHEAEALSGVKSFAGGMSGEGYGKVVAGIKGMLDASGKREMNILRRLAKGVIDIGNKIMAMNAVFLSEEETIRVTNTKFVKVRREDLKGNFDLIVDISTAEVDEAKAQDLGFMLQTMGPDMDPAMSRMILSDIAKLKRMPELANRIDTYQPEPDPFQEEMKQLELELKKTQIEKLKSEIAENNADAGKKQAEAMSSGLEMMRTQTGESHAEKLDMVGEQARANQDLEITKSLLKPRKPEESAPDVMAAVGYNELTDPTKVNTRRF